MQTIGIDIGTTTIRGVVLEKSGTQKPRVLEAKTIENGSFFQNDKGLGKDPGRRKDCKEKQTDKCGILFEKKDGDK